MLIVAYHHFPNRIGVGAYTIKASRSHHRRFSDGLDRREQPRRATSHLTIRLGSVPELQAVFHALRAQITNR